MPVIEDERAEARRMRDQEGKSERAIATALGRSNSTIHKWLSEPAEPEPPADPDPIPGQQTIDGSEVPAAQNGNGAVYVEEIRIDGTAQLGLLDFGGKDPQSATLKLRLGTVQIFDGRAFRKGDTIHFAGTAVVDFVGGKDKVDKTTGIPVTATQVHEARVVDLSIVAE